MPPSTQCMTMTQKVNGDVPLESTLIIQQLRTTKRMNIKPMVILMTTFSINLPRKKRARKVVQRHNQGSTMKALPQERPGREEILLRNEPPLTNHCKRETQDEHLQHRPRMTFQRCRRRRRVLWEQQVTRARCRRTRRTIVQQRRRESEPLLKMAKSQRSASSLTMLSAVSKRVTRISKDGAVRASRRTDPSRATPMPITIVSMLLVFLKNMVHGTKRNTKSS
mmetsp:Transcript_3621/g.13827  ORF Transcript_3621/g.13827 Transcript_3621/m.13827 type:complete len:223 (+) Transcript_3621:702-1370(+)